MKIETIKGTEVYTKVKEAFDNGTKIDLKLEGYKEYISLDEFNRVMSNLRKTVEMRKVCLGWNNAEWINVDNCISEVIGNHGKN